MIATIQPVLAPFPYSLSPELGRVAQWHLILDEGERYAVTWGLIRCHVGISAGLWRVLDDSARTAVLHHEAAHARVLDPLQQASLQVLSDGFRPLGLAALYERYLIRREIIADARAIAACHGDDLPLLTALQAAVGPKPGVSSRVGLAGALEARIQYLDSHKMPTWLDSRIRFRLAVSLASAVLAAIEGWLVWCHW